MPKLNRMRLARARPAGGLTLLSRPLIAFAPIASTRLLAPTQVGDPVHFIGFEYKGEFNWRLGFAADATGDGLIFAQTNTNRFTLYRGRLTDPSNTWVSINAGNNVFWNPPAVDTELQARINEDGTCGLYAGATTVLLVPANSGHSAGVKGDYVSFSQSGGTLPTNIRYGGQPSPMLITKTTYDAFTRNLDVDVSYTNIDTTGTLPTTPQVDYGNGVQRAMTVIANPSAGKATLRDTLPKSISGYKLASARWGNLPSSAQPFATEIVLPFGGKLGGNSKNLDMEPFAWGWRSCRAENSTGRSIVGLYQYAVPGVDYPRTSNGVGGVMGDVDYKIGRNDQGISYYYFSTQHIFTDAELGDYVMQFQPGLDISQGSVNLAPFNWQYNQSTGVGTFTISVVGLTGFGLRLAAASIPPGTVVDMARPKKTTRLSATADAQYVAFQKAVSDGPRPLDTNSGVNNKNVNNRTLFATPIATVANEGTHWIDLEIQETIECASTFCFAFNTNLDDVGLVTYRAQQYAARVPLSCDVFLGLANEEFNLTTFTHPHDMIMEGVRQGFHAVTDASQTRTPVTLMQAYATYSPTILTNQGGQAQFTVVQPIASGTNFYCAVDGGYFVFTALQDYTVGQVVNYNNAKLGVADPKISMLASNGDCIAAMKRYESHLVKRNLGIWRDAFATAGRPAPIGCLNGFAADTAWADVGMNWGDLRAYLAEARGGRLTIAPYFNLGFGGFNCMNYNETRIWDATAKAMISANDYAGAAAYITPKAIALLSLQATYLASYKAGLYAKNVAAGLAPDAVKLHFYEFGDHSAFGNNYPNWPSITIGSNFYYTWVTTSAYYDFLKAYYRMMAAVGAEGHTYTTQTGSRPFGMASTYYDTALTGPNTNWVYKALKETIDDVRAAVAA